VAAAGNHQILWPQFGAGEKGYRFEKRRLYSLAHRAALQFPGKRYLQAIQVYN
jgi:hypothetical protein